MRNLFLCVAMLFSFAIQAEECTDFSGKQVAKICEQNFHTSDYEKIRVVQKGCPEISIDGDKFTIGSVKNISDWGYRKVIQTGWSNNGLKQIEVLHEFEGKNSTSYVVNKEYSKL